MSALPYWGHRAKAGIQESPLTSQAFSWVNLKMALPKRSKALLTSKLIAAVNLYGWMPEHAAAVQSEA